jgi:hypothetical protein
MWRMLCSKRDQDTSWHHEDALTANDNFGQPRSIFDSFNRSNKAPIDQRKEKWRVVVVLMMGTDWTSIPRFISSDEQTNAIDLCGDKQERIVGDCQTYLGA